jgi:hypothetical protein
MILNNRTPKILSRYGVTKFFLSLFLSLSLCFYSCDESSVVGLDVQPSNDVLNVSSSDTTSLITKTVREDSLRTDELVIGDASVLLGKYRDPVFGDATASVYTQVALSTNIISSSFGQNPVCDSIILSLVYDPNYYGKRDRKQQTVNVYEVTEAIPAGEKFSSKTLLTSTITPLANFNFIPKPTDSVLLSGIKVKPQLRIPLSTGFGQGFLSNPVNLANNAAFQAYMKGFYITTENSILNAEEGTMMKFKMAESKITMYYHYVGKAKVLTPTGYTNIVNARYDFGLGNVSRFTHFAHDYSVSSNTNADLLSQLSATPPAENEVVFIQSMAGLKTKIEFPSLMHWNDSGAVAINKAELIIKAVYGGPGPLLDTYVLDTFAAPPALFLFSIEDAGHGTDYTGKNYFLPDPFVGSNYFDGNYNATEKAYHFNIARYVQQVLTGRLKNGGLLLVASGSAARTQRVVIGGGKSSSPYQMKLNITYTKLH